MNRCSYWTAGGTDTILWRHFATAATMVVLVRIPWRSSSLFSFLVFLNNWQDGNAVRILSEGIPAFEMSKTAPQHAVWWQTSSCVSHCGPKAPDGTNEEDSLTVSSMKRAWLGCWWSQPHLGTHLISVFNDVLNFILQYIIDSGRRRENLVSRVVIEWICF